MSEKRKPTSTLLDPLRSIKRRGRVPVQRILQKARYRNRRVGDLPIVFGNAMPKSGSQILFNLMKALPVLGPFVLRYLRPVRTLTPEGRRRATEEIVSDVARMRPGDVAYGYIRATPENQQALDDPARVVFFVYRDPRDRLISHILYATEMHEGHRMRAYYRQALGTMEERIAATITGITEEGYELPSIRMDYERYLAWLDHPRVLGIRFEDLIHRREDVLGQILDHVESTGFRLPIDRSEAIDRLNQAMDPRRSPTFRSGKTGSWREYFSDSNKALFKEVAGDLLILLNYESSMEW